MPSPLASLLMCLIPRHAIGPLERLYERKQVIPCPVEVVPQPRASQVHRDVPAAAVSVVHPRVATNQ